MANLVAPEISVNWNQAESLREVRLEAHRQARETAVTTETSVAVDSRDFMDNGNCRGKDPDIFFPERGASLRPAQRICAGCVVRNECLEYALQHGERFGVWGGASERERRRIRRTRRLGASAIEAA